MTHTEAASPDKIHVTFTDQELKNDMKRLGLSKAKIEKAIEAQKESMLRDKDGNPYNVCKTSLG